MRANQLLLRFYAERKGSQWQAFCIDLDLAAQGDSLQEVQKKIVLMAVSYVVDAFGQDREHADVLLSRKAPLRNRLRYQWLHLQNRVVRAAKNHLAFERPLPLRVADNPC